MFAEMAREAPAGADEQCAAAAKYRTRPAAAREQPAVADDQRAAAAKYRTHKAAAATPMAAPEASSAATKARTQSAPSRNKTRPRHGMLVSANGTRCDAAADSPYATVPYNSPLVDDSLNGRVLITARSSVVENDRQLIAVDLDGRAYTSGHLQSLPLHRSLLNSISQLLGIQSTEPGVLLGSASLTPSHTKQRDLQVRLCMNDPLISEQHRMAHKLYVTGKPISELRAAGIEAVHLSEIGVTYDDWSQCCDMGVRDLVFLNADWQLLLQMGFQPRHIVNDRSKSGANVLSEPPLCVNYQTLEETLGLTIDEAVFTLAFTTADFAVLGETVTTLRRRGFDRSHVQHMQEPVFNFESALRGTQTELAVLFEDAEPVEPLAKPSPAADQRSPPTRPRLPTPMAKTPKATPTTTKKAFSVF